MHEVSATSVLVDWDPVIGAERYHVYAGAALNAMQLRGSATGRELTVGGLTAGTKYFFHVTSLPVPCRHGRQASTPPANPSRATSPAGRRFEGGKDIEGYKDGTLGS